MSKINKLNSTFIINDIDNRFIIQSSNVKLVMGIKKKENGLDEQMTFCHLRILFNLHL